MVLDQIWFDKYKKIEAYKRSYFVNKNPEFEFQGDKLIITNNIAYLPDYEKQKLIRFANKKKRRLLKLAERIENEEADDFIRKKYLYKIVGLTKEIEVYLLQLSSELTPYEKAKEISSILESRYPQVEVNLLQKFICEFIDFVKFLSQKNQELLPFTEPSFYGIEYKPTNINFEKLYQQHLQRSETKNQFEQKKYFGPEIKKILRRFLKKIDLKRIIIRVEDRMLFSVEPIYKRINVPVNVETSATRIIELIAHEVCVHIVRSIYGYRNKDKNGNSINLLGMSNSQEIDTEEGIATYFEQNIFGKSDKYDLFVIYQFYISAISVYLAKQFEPKEVYEKLLAVSNALYKVINPDQSGENNIAEKRIKRIYSSFPEAVKGFVNPKVAVYLIGNRDIWEYVESGGNVINLFAGKVGVEELSIIKKKGFSIPQELFGEKEIDFEELRSLIESCF